MQVVRVDLAPENKLHATHKPQYGKLFWCVDSQGRILIQGSQACHVLALKGSEDGKIQSDIHSEYTRICDKLGGLGNIKGKKKREQVINALMKLWTDLTPNSIGAREREQLYLCGGFYGNDVTPAHMWLEDNSLGITIDTMAGCEILIYEHINAGDKGWLATALTGHVVDKNAYTAAFYRKITHYSAYQYNIIRLYADAKAKKGGVKTIKRSRTV